MWTLPAESQMILLVPAVLWHQRMWKYFKSYKQDWFYNVELLFEKVGYNIHTVCIKIAPEKIKNTVYHFCLNIFKS
jgi:hypothetical protein